MVEIFKTNIRRKVISEGIISILRENFPNYRINFDLEDRDKILRVEADYLRPHEIMHLLQREGIACEILH